MKNEKEFKKIDEARSQLIELAGQMALKSNMPSTHIEDYSFHKSTGITDRKKIIKLAEKAEFQCITWACYLRDVCDFLYRNSRDKSGGLSG